MSRYTVGIDPSVRVGGAGHCTRPTTVRPLPRDARNSALSRTNAPNARSSTARGRERNGTIAGGKTSTMRRQRLGMPLSRRIDAFMTCTRESAMRTPPTRLVTATKVASTGDTRTDRSTSTYFVSRARLSRYTVGIDPSVRVGGAGHCTRPTTVRPLPRDARNSALSRANAPNARSSTARGGERNGTIEAARRVLCDASDSACRSRAGPTFS